MEADPTTIINEQVNSVPFLLGLREDLGIRALINAHVDPHGHWQGISVGRVVSIWLCHLLMERDHRLVAVRDWAAARPHTLNALLGIELRHATFVETGLVGVVTGQIRSEAGLLASLSSVLGMKPEDIKAKYTQPWVKPDLFVPIKAIPVAQMDGIKARHQDTPGYFGRGA